MAQMPLQVKKPTAILLDFVGTIAKSSFIEGTLQPYLRENVQFYLEQNWDSEAVQQDIANLRSMAEQMPGGPQIAPQWSEGAADSSISKEQMIASTVAFVEHCSATGKVSDALSLMHFHMAFDGLKRGRLQTPVYSDVAAQLAKWTAPPGAIRLYLASNSWSEASRRLLASTSHGDLTPFFAGYFDTANGELTEATSYKAIIAQMEAALTDGASAGGTSGGSTNLTVTPTPASSSSSATSSPPPETVLFLTKNVTVARAAIAAGLNAILVLTHRRSILKLDEEGKKLPRVRSLNDIVFV